MVVGQSNVNVVNGLMAVPGVRAAHERAECGAEIKKKCEIFFGQLLLKSRFADSTMCNKNWYQTAETDFDFPFFLSPPFAQSATHKILMLRSASGIIDALGNSFRFSFVAFIIQ